MKKGYVSIPEGQIHYITEGDGEPLLLFHQAPLCSTEWEQVIPILSKTFCVIAPDMAGHGASFDPEREFEMEDFTRTTLQFMDALGIKKAFLAGNHSGAALALSIAATAPERVLRLAVSCEMLVTQEQIAGFLQALKSRPMSRDLPMTEDGSFLVDTWTRYKALGPSADLATRFKAFAIGLAARQRPYDAHYPVLRWMGKEMWLGKVKCPTLIFGADRDVFYNRAQLEEAPKRFPHASIAIIEGPGALSPFEKPREIAQLLLDFFERD